MKHTVHSLESYLQFPWFLTHLKEKGLFNKYFRLINNFSITIDNSYDLTHG